MPSQAGSTFYFVLQFGVCYSSGISACQHKLKTDKFDSYKVLHLHGIDALVSI